MPKYVRKLEKAVWWDSAEGASENALTSDALKNAATNNGELSIYEVPSDDDLLIIMAALAYRRNALRDVDFCIFDGSALDACEIKTSRTRGNTGCRHVDELHLDMVSLTAISVTRFVCKAAHSGLLDSFDKEQVKNKIIELVGNGDLDATHIHVDMKKVLSL